MYNLQKTEPYPKHLSWYSLVNGYNDSPTLLGNFNFTIPSYSLFMYVYNTCNNYYNLSVSMSLKIPYYRTQYIQAGSQNFILFCFFFWSGSFLKVYKYKYIKCFLKKKVGIQKKIIPLVTLLVCMMKTINYINYDLFFDDVPNTFLHSLKF